MFRKFSNKNILLLFIAKLVICTGLVACREAASPTFAQQQSGKTPPLDTTIGQKNHYNNNHGGYCGGGEPSAVPMQTDRPDVPIYINTLPITYIADVDENIFSFSPRLWEWVIDEIKFSMKGFEGYAQLGEISERRVIWKLVSASDQLANVEKLIVTKSARYPDGASVRYTYLFNRYTDRQFEIRHLFSDRVEADAQIRRLLVDALLPLRARNLKTLANDKALIEDTNKKLPDEILDSLDLNLFQPQDAEAFTGITISIPDSGPWNYLPESGYIVTIESSQFSHLLKPECSTIFTQL